MCLLRYTEKRLIDMSNKIKIAIIAVFIAVLVACAAGIIYYVKNKMIVYDKDGMIYKSTEIHEQGDDDLVNNT